MKFHFWSGSKREDAFELRRVGKTDSILKEDLSECEHGGERHLRTGFYVSGKKIVRHGWIRRR
jgi:hypothetical protein